MKQMSKVRRLLSCLLVLVGGLLSMAPTPGNLKIAEYPGSSEKEGREGTSDVFAVDHELVRPIDPQTGQLLGVRQHKPLTVLKVIDKATPGLNKALITSQNLAEVVLDFYRIDPATRAEVKYYTITLKDARVIGDKVMMPTSFDPAYESYRHMEEVRFVYGTIEWRWLPDNVVETDRWRATDAGAAAASIAEKAKTDNKAKAAETAGEGGLVKVNKASTHSTVKSAEVKPNAKVNSPDKK